MTRLYPLYADIADRLVVVVGGGRVSERKIGVLLECQAKVRLISPEVTEKLDEMASQGRIELLRRPYQSGDLTGTFLVIASCDDQQVNRQVFDEANSQHIFCNVVDVPELCSFHVPAIVRRGHLQLAISTRGSSPALAKLIRKTLEKEFGPYYETFMEAMLQLREHVKAKYPESQPQRAEILDSFVNSNALELLRNGQTEQFYELFEQWKQK